MFGFVFDSADPAVRSSAWEARGSAMTANAPKLLIFDILYVVSDVANVQIIYMYDVKKLFSNVCFLFLLNHGNTFIVFHKNERNQHTLQPANLFHQDYQAKGLPTEQTI